MKLKDLDRNLNEGPRGGTGGAFGRGGPGPRRQQYKGGSGFGRGGVAKSTWSGPEGMDTSKGMSGLDHATRLKMGRQMEAAVARKLEELGIKVVHSGREDDAFKGIDFWVTLNDKRISAQVKQREVGDDIIFEIWKDYDGSSRPNGRDYNGKAQLYIAVDTKGNGFWVVPSVLKNTADEYLAKYGMKNGTHNGAFFKVTKDNRTKTTKLMAFFPPSKFGKPIPGFKA